MKSVKGYQYVLSVFLFPLGPFLFLLLLSLVMWASYQLINSFTNDLKFAGNVAIVLTSAAAALLLLFMISIALMKSKSPLKAAYWFPLSGIVIYYFFSALFWRFVYGLGNLSPKIFMGPVMIYNGGGPMINIIGLDLMALIATFLIGILVVSFWAIFNHWDQ